MMSHIENSRVSIKFVYNLSYIVSFTTSKILHILSWYFLPRDPLAVYMCLFIYLIQKVRGSQIDASIVY